MELRGCTIPSIWIRFYLNLKLIAPNISFVSYSYNWNTEWLVYWLKFDHYTQTRKKYRKWAEKLYTINAKVDTSFNYKACKKKLNMNVKFLIKTSSIVMYWKRMSCECYIWFFPLRQHYDACMWYTVNNNTVKYYSIYPKMTQTWRWIIINIQTCWEKHVLFTHFGGLLPSKYLYKKR